MRWQSRLSAVACRLPVCGGQNKFPVWLPVSSLAVTGVFGGGMHCSLTLTLGFAKFLGQRLSTLLNEFVVRN